ncbi:DYNC1H1 [Cordylochernes scorpioides]|uniref:DYNC1H1 n=1 Tax=Cordylochernes scorpioides TaxID=51811 RepID=A0ABY6L1R6_9ARAC|nr:DYNC1H1 [Cordylochernes scorpioides]
MNLSDLLHRQDTTTISKLHRIHNKVYEVLLRYLYLQTRFPTQNHTAVVLLLPQILIQSVCETLVPKLVAEDIPLLFSLLTDVFPGVGYNSAEMAGLRDAVKTVCAEMFLVAGEQWVQKVLQLYQISQLNHGLMMVGPSGAGKTTAWRVLLRALERYEGVEGVAHLIDPKAISKEALYGTLDPNTREWTDGLFTHVLRKIIDNVRGEINKRQWIIFDGDVDPEWVENLNSVLDDNKLLTLPNGERLSLPPNVRIMFEVQDLRYATLATVSRCGMVWFSEDVLSTDMIFQHFLLRLRSLPLEDSDEDEHSYKKKIMGSDSSKDDHLSPTLQVLWLLYSLEFSSGELLHQATISLMEVVTVLSDSLTKCFACCVGLKQALATVNDYNPLMKDFPLNDLLAATELDKIRAALHAIFGHLRKIRNTKYPIQRALRLVEAISRDLMAQLLKVLGTRRLMHIPFDEFEKVNFRSCHTFLTLNLYMFLQYNNVLSMDFVF